MAQQLLGIQEFDLDEAVDHHLNLANEDEEQQDVDLSSMFAPIRLFTDVGREDTYSKYSMDFYRTLTRSWVTVTYTLEACIVGMREVLKEEKREREC